MLYERQDWTLFRTLPTLAQKAGVPQRLLRRLVVKELVDNALDAGHQVEFERMGPNSYRIQDDGPGIPGTPEEIARLFSIARPLSSSKLLRLPLRGALGNGLRVVVGTVLATNGTLEVTTRGTHYHLRPLDDGSTIILSQTEADHIGTQIILHLGPGVPEDPLDLQWARLAKAFPLSNRYSGKTSPHWYDSESFYELLLAAGPLSPKDLISQFHGFGTRRRETDPDTFLFLKTLNTSLPTTACNEYSREQADTLLGFLQEASPPIPAHRMGRIQPVPTDAGYQKFEGTLILEPTRGHHVAAVPYVIEVLALESDSDQDVLQPYVNGTPITGEMEVQRHRANQMAVFGCGISHYIEGVSRQKCHLHLNLQSPYVPITSDGKSPDFGRYLEGIAHTLQRSTRKLRAKIQKNSGQDSQTQIVQDALQEAIDRVSTQGAYRYSLRQLYYAIRPLVLERTEGTDLNYDHFSQIITKCEAALGADLPGMYRDPRGTLYHPHLGHEIPLGTLAVEQYERPPYLIRNVLYCEKEGFNHLLRSVGWPERQDCALLSSKGFASRAVRDVIDLLGENDDEPITFFCIHDADSSGTLIHQTLQKATAARPERRVHIVNLGLEPWEAVEMGLQVETFSSRSHRPVAQYVLDHPDDSPEGIPWSEWLQTRRVELNAMTSAQFLRWLDEKMEIYGTEKVVPPEQVLRQALKEQAQRLLREEITQEILEQSEYTQRLHEAMQEIQPYIDSVPVAPSVEEALKKEPQNRWTAPVDSLAREITGRRSKAQNPQNPPAPANENRRPPSPSGPDT